MGFKLSQHKELQKFCLSSFWVISVLCLSQSYSVWPLKTDCLFCLLLSSHFLSVFNSKSQSMGIFGWPVTRKIFTANYLLHFKSHWEIMNYKIIKAVASVKTKFKVKCLTNSCHCSFKHYVGSIGEGRHLFPHWIMQKHSLIKKGGSLWTLCFFTVYFADKKCGNLHYAFHSASLKMYLYVDLSVSEGLPPPLFLLRKTLTLRWRDIMTTWGLTLCSLPTLHPTTTKDGYSSTKNRIFFFHWSPLLLYLVAT